MQDTFGREVTIGDIVVKVYDWGAWDMALIVGTTPAGFLRSSTLSIKSDIEHEFRKSYMVKSTKNAVILDENLLTSFVRKNAIHLCRYFDETIDDYREIPEQRIIDILLEEQRMIKETVNK